MQYFVSWTHSDPVYQHYLPDVSVLISPPNVNQIWQIERWSSLPKALIVDSGAFQYHRSGTHPLPEYVLRRQLHLIGTTLLPTGICHLDIPLLGIRQVSELERRITTSLLNARWLINYAAQHTLPHHVVPIGVIQGYNVETIFYSAQVLAEMGYQRFALGSLIGIVTNGRDELLRRVEAVLEAVGANVHVLGISSVPVLTALIRLGVASADSGAPMHEASRGGVFYSQPFRRFKIDTPHFREWTRSYGFADVLEAPLPCDCPVCMIDPTHLLDAHGKPAVNRRGLHNYYHLRREIAAS